MMVENTMAASIRSGREGEGNDAGLLDDGT